MLLWTYTEKLLSVSSFCSFFQYYSTKDDIKSINARVVVARFFTQYFPKHCFLRCTGTRHGKNNTKKTAIIT